jgi:hypothetical protein
MPVMATDKLPELVATSGDPFAKASVPNDMEFAKAQAEFLDSPELAFMASRIIESHKLKLADQVTVTYLWKRKGGASSGKVVFGKCTKTSGMVEYFAAQTRRSHVDYIIWLAADNVRGSGMAAWQIEALLHHEILHITAEYDKNDEIKLGVVGHDWEGFDANISAYGLWWTNFQQMGEHVRQLKLGGLDGAIDNMRAVKDRLAGQGITMPARIVERS